MPATSLEPKVAEAYRRAWADVPADLVAQMKPPLTKIRQQESAFETEYTDKRQKLELALAELVPSLRTLGVPEATIKTSLESMVTSICNESNWVRRYNQPAAWRRVNDAAEDRWFTLDDDARARFDQVAAHLRDSEKCVGPYCEVSGGGRVFSPGFQVFLDMIRIRALDRAEPSFRECAARWDELRFK